MKEVEIKINGSFVTALDRFSLVQYEISSTELNMTFSEDWEGLGVVISFYDARNEKAVCVPLVIENGKSTVQIPPEALIYPGTASFIIDGFTTVIEENQDETEETQVETVNYLIRTKPYEFKVNNAFKRGEGEPEKISASDYEKIIALLAFKADVSTLNDVLNILEGKADSEAVDTVIFEIKEVLFGKADNEAVDEALETLSASVNERARSSEVYTKEEVYTKTETYSKEEVLQQIANKIAEMVDSAPATLDTLNELAQALGNDPNFATTMATEIGKRAKAEDVYPKAEADEKFQSQLTQEQLDAIADVENKADSEAVDKALEGKADTEEVAEARAYIDTEIAEAKAYTDTKASEVNQRIDALGNVYQVKGSIKANNFTDINSMNYSADADRISSGYVFNVDGDGVALSRAYAQGDCPCTVSNGKLTVQWDDIFEYFPDINHDSLLMVYKDYVTVDSKVYKIESSSIIFGSGYDCEYILIDPPEDGEYHIHYFWASIEVNNGDNVVWTDTGWDKLSGDIDLSSYYTKTEVDNKIGDIETALDNIITQQEAIIEIQNTLGGDSV